MAEWERQDVKMATIYDPRLIYKSSEKRNILPKRYLICLTILRWQRIRRSDKGCLRRTIIKRSCTVLCPRSFLLHFTFS